MHPSRQNESGIKRPIVDAVRLGRPEDGSPPQSFTYYVVETRDAGDKRSARRRRTRLRSGKILAPCNALLSDCQIYDRSEKGARVRLAGDMNAGDIKLPRNIRLYEDWPESLIEASVVWRKDREIGLSFHLNAPPRRISRVQLAKLRGNIYTALR